MQLHKLQPKHKRPQKKRVGRGGKKGTYSGRGIKGQKARAGRNLAPVVREFLKRYPKRKGYRRVQRQRRPQTVTLRQIAANFSKDGAVSPKALLEKGLVRKGKGVLKIKIVGAARIKNPLSFTGCAFSAGAKRAVQEAGGTII